MNLSATNFLSEVSYLAFLPPPYLLILRRDAVRATIVSRFVEVGDNFDEDVETHV